MKTLLATVFCLVPLSAAHADASAPACLPVTPDGKPVLNFQQPDVSDAQVRSVVTNAVIPAWNRFHVLNAMAPAGTPLVQVTWNPNQFTGMPDLPAGTKWGSVNAYANSAVMVSGRTVGMWADGADADLKPSPLQSGRAAHSIQGAGSRVEMRRSSFSTPTTSSPSPTT